MYDVPVGMALYDIPVLTGNLREGPGGQPQEEFSITVRDGLRREKYRVLEWRDVEMESEAENE